MEGIPNGFPGSSALAPSQGSPSMLFLGLFITRLCLVFFYVATLGGGCESSGVLFILGKCSTHPIHPIHIDGG